MKRLLSLDAFRGLTIVAMILVNSPGNQTAYAWLNHAAWNGCKFADYIFPSFLFIVGMSLVYSVTQQKQKQIAITPILFKISKRTILIFALGLFLNAFPKHMDWETLRIPGVLQRIALCYFFASLLFITTNARTQVIILISLLIGYWLMMIYIPVPGFGPGDLTPAGNLAAYLDRLLLTPAHLYTPLYDPEGLLSTLPAIATTMLGVLIADQLQKTKNKQKQCLGMIMAAVTMAALGLIWNNYFPINKALWTSSYVLWTGCSALLIFTLCYWLIEVKHWQRWSTPLVIFGVNAIAAYFLHIFFLKLQAMIHLSRLNGSAGNLRFYITEHLFYWAPLKLASLLYACCYILLWLAVLGWLYRKKIYLKI